MERFRGPVRDPQTLTFSPTTAPVAPTRPSAASERCHERPAPRTSGRPLVDLRAPPPRTRCQGSEDIWKPACSGSLVDRTSLNCTFYGLEEGTDYNFRIRESCEDRCSGLLGAASGFSIDAPRWAASRGPAASTCSLASESQGRERVGASRGRAACRRGPYPMPSCHGRAESTPMAAARALPRRLGRAASGIGAHLSLP